MMHLLSKVVAVAIVLLSPATWAAGDWTNDWFDQSATTSAGSFQTQQRGYYTAGSFQGRWRMTNDYPLSVSPPRFKAGCGGIDLFGGGFSYLDPEYLVEKFERIIQAAPSFAFEMAMQEYCKPCSSAMQTMTQITDYLNSIQVNDCRMAKQIAAIPVKGDMTVFDDMKEKAMQGYAIGEGILKNTQNVDEELEAADGKSPVDTRELVASCPASFKTVFTNGSVVANVAGLVGLSDYADLTRGLIGDVIVSYNSTVNGLVTAPVEPCPGNDQLSGADLLTGTLQKKNVGGTCSSAGASRVADVVEDRLSSIATKMAPGGSALSSDDIAFINSAPFPLYALLRDAVASRTVAETIESIRDPLANAYAYRMLDDLHRMSRLVLSKANEISTSQRFGSGDPSKCDTKFLKDSFVKIQAMDELALKYRELAKANYAKEQQELSVNIQVARDRLQQRQQMLRDNAASLK